MLDIQDTTYPVETLHLEAKMPPKPPPTKAQLYAEFKEKTDEFDEEEEAAEELGGKIPDRIVEGLGDQYKQVLKLARDLKMSEN